MTFALWLYSGNADGSRRLIADDVELPADMAVTMNVAMVRTLYRWFPKKVKP